MSSSNGEAVLLGDRAQGLANYPHARKLPNGLVFISGISSRRPDNTWEGVESQPDGTFKLDISKQTRAVIQNIEAILKASGGGLQNLVDLTVFLVDMADYNRFNAVYNEFFPDALKGPSRTTVAVKQLPNPRLLIEIKSTAYII